MRVSESRKDLAKVTDYPICEFKTGSVNLVGRSSAMQAWSKFVAAPRSALGSLSETTPPHNVPIESHDNRTGKFV